MVLTRDFKQTLLVRVRTNPKLHDALLRESSLLAGNVNSHKAIQCDYIKPMVGFLLLGTEASSLPNCPIRMFVPTGYPQARYLFSVISPLQRHAR